MLPGQSKTKDDAEMFWLLKITKQLAFRKKYSELLEIFHPILSVTALLQLLFIAILNVAKLLLVT